MFSKFKNLIKTNQIIFLDSMMKINNTDMLLPNIIPSKNLAIISIDNSNIFIQYNKKTTNVTCIFCSELEYIQTEFYLNRINKLFSYEVYFIKYFKNILLSDSINCLLLGLGLGHLPNVLINMFNDKIKTIECVEINKSLCNFYKKYFRISPKIKVIHNDAKKYVQKCNKKFNCIFIDIPCFILTKTFMLKIYELVKNDNIICLNLCGNDCLKLNYKNLFDNTIIHKHIKLDENNIYILSINKSI